MTRMNVPVSSEVHGKLKAYSEMTGIPISVAANKALSDWLDSVAPAHIEALAGRVAALAMTSDGGDGMKLGNNRVDNAIREVSEMVERTMERSSG